MESEPAPWRAHVDLIGRSSKAAQAATYTPSPWWFWAAIGLLSPAIVAARRLAGLERAATVALLVVPALIAGTAMWRREKSAPARLSSPGRRGPFLWWRLPMLSVFIGTLQLSAQLAPTIVLGLFSYLAIAVGSGLCARQADAEFLKWVQR